MVKLINVLLFLRIQIQSLHLYNDHKQTWGDFLIFVLNVLGLFQSMMRESPQKSEVR